MTSVLSPAHVARRGAAALGPAADAISEQLAVLERRLANGKAPGPLGDICTGLFVSGGKRLRAMSCLVVGDAIGTDPGICLDLAEAVELTHGATLLHDDVIDEADRRRGQIAARRQWSNTLSILGGDYLLLRALRLVAGTSCATLVAEHMRTLDLLLSAEVAQNVSKREGDLSIAGYLDVAAGKTGSLFAFACSAPALLIAEVRAARQLERFGRHTGVAFQIADDVRDLLGTDPTKPTSLDLADGVMTLPLRIAAREDGELAAALRRACTQVPAPVEVAAMARRVLATGGVHGAITVGREHLQLAADALAELDAYAGLRPLTFVVEWLEEELAVAERAAP